MAYDIIIVNNEVQVYVADEKIGSELVMKYSDQILDGEISGLKLIMKDKIVFVSAKDKNHLLFRAESIN